MLGAIVGDMVGSQVEWKERQEYDFPFFTSLAHYTDDTLMTLAIGEAFMLRRGRWRDADFQSFVIERMVKMGRAHQSASWGGRFYEWFMKRPLPYNSFGNGAAMRVSSVGWISESEDDVRYFSKLVTEVSHNHPEGLKGAECVAMAIYLARCGKSMDEIRKRMIEYYPEIETMSVKGIRREYGIDQAGRFITCQGSVPQSVVCFLESKSFEDAVRLAVSLGGDTDTQGAICGSIAEAYYGVSPEIEDEVVARLTEPLLTIYYAFGVVKGKRIPRKQI